MSTVNEEVFEEVKKCPNQWQQQFILTKAKCANDWERLLELSLWMN